MKRVIFMLLLGAGLLAGCDVRTLEEIDYLNQRLAECYAGRPTEAELAQREAELARKHERFLKQLELCEKFLKDGKPTKCNFGGLI